MIKWFFSLHVLILPGSCIDYSVPLFPSSSSSLQLCSIDSFNPTVFICPSLGIILPPRPSYPQFPPHPPSSLVQLCSIKSFIPNPSCPLFPFLFFLDQFPIRFVWLESQIIHIEQINKHSLFCLLIDDVELEKDRSDLFPEKQQLSTTNRQSCLILIKVLWDECQAFLFQRSILLNLPLRCSGPGNWVERVLKLSHQKNMGQVIPPLHLPLHVKFANTSHLHHISISTCTS